VAGGRWVDVPPSRIAKWAENFAARHGPTVAEAGPAAIVLRAEDGTTAACHPPFPPLAQPPGPLDSTDAVKALAAHASASRTVGVLLVRLGGYAAGVFTGSPPRLVSSKTGARLVHGRSAAGGWSQQRFARRREKQAAGALAAAGDAAAAVLLPCASELEAVVLGGDKRAAATVAADPRLRPVMDRVAGDRFLTVPDPRLAVLRDTPRLFQAIKVHLSEPG
jgi:Actinobacteria/chloroflexi VLRF1 release factor